MALESDFERLVHFLRSGSVPPDELARLARLWTPDSDPPFHEFVAVATAAYQSAGPPAPAETGTFDADRGDSTATADGPPNPAATTLPYSDHDRHPLPPPPTGGRYVPLRLHRTGGLGAVWLARDSAVGREVALKTIRPGRRTGPAQVARFLREAQVTGRLEHPCIVPVYDLPAAGPGGEPCYVMRFVAGRTLAESAADYHRDRAAGRADPLALAGLLDAVVAVARAVGFAHARGVLHRDLKGQNVVIGAFGEVFLLDWGLAKEEKAGDDAPSGSGSGSADETPPGSAVGTPAFMAPEVAARGAATKATDVYGLGGVLFQVLTGRPPRELKSVANVLKEVESEDPPPVREVNPSAPPALAAICRKALAHDPAARYATADDFATDLRRFLADEPVSAYAEPWPARAARWARRHRTGVAVAAALLLATAIGSAVAAALVWREKERTTAEWVRAEGEWRRAEAEKERAEKEKDRAEGHYAVAGGLAFDLSGRITALETGLVESKARDRQRKAALDVARQAFDRLVADRPDDTALRRRAASLHWYAANLGRFLGHLPTTEAAYTSSIRLWEGLVAEQPGDPGDQDRLTQTLSDYAVFLRRDGKLAEASRILDRAKDQAAGLEGRIPQSAVRRTRGLIELDRADVDHRAVGLFDGLASVPKTESNPIDLVLAAAAHHQRAIALEELDRHPDALKEHDIAVIRADAACVAKGTRDARHYANRTRLGRAAAAGRDPAGREAAARELGGVIEKGEALSAEYPSAVAYKELVAEAYLLRGELTPDGGADLKKAYDLSKKLIDEYKSPLLADHVALRGRVFLVMGKAAPTPVGAADLLNNAVKAYRIARERDPDNTFIRRELDEAERALRAIPR